MTTGRNEFNQTFSYDARAESYCNHLSRLISRLAAKGITRESEIYQTVETSDYRDFKHAPLGGDGKSYLFRKKSASANFDTCTVPVEFLGQRATMMRKASIIPDVTTAAQALERARVESQRKQNLRAVLATAAIASL